MFIFSSQVALVSELTKPGSLRICILPPASAPLLQHQLQSVPPPRCHVCFQVCCSFCPLPSIQRIIPMAAGLEGTMEFIWTQLTLKAGLQMRFSGSSSGQGWRVPSPRPLCSDTRSSPSPPFWSLTSSPQHLPPILPWAVAWEQRARC